ncbi:MAG: hypothetical protein K8R59_03370 [Thermoanaerobaculales bacterium]|nr:hypothetical protein [Thermoanaerobaculales bacterium]
MTPKRRTIITLTIIGLVGVTPLWADQPMGPEIPVSELDNEQYMPHVAYNSVHDQYLVVWHNTWGSGRDVYGRRLDGEGNLLSWFSISAGATDRAQPAVAYDEINDRYLVVWSQDYDGTGTDWDLYGRLIPWNGPEPTMGDFPIETNSRSQWSAEVAFALAQQEFLVVWNNDDGSTPLDVEGRRVLLDGSFPINSVFMVASGAGDRTNPDIAYNLSRNEYLVTYDLVGADILGTRLTAGGVVLGGGEFAIAAWTDLESRPAVAACRGGADHYFVAWQSLVGADWDIYGRFVTGDGVPDGAPVHFYLTSIDEQHPDVTCHTGIGEYLVVWEQQFSNSSGPFGISGQRLTTSRSLSPSFQIRPVIAGETGVCSQPATAAGEQGFLVAWEHDRQGTSYQDIHGRIVMAGLFSDGFESGNTNAWSSMVW